MCFLSLSAKNTATKQGFLSTKPPSKCEFPRLDRGLKLCYILSVKGCDEDMRKSKILREEAVR